MTSMYTATCGILLLGSDSQAKKAAQFTSVLQNILTQQKISRILFENNNPIPFTQLTRGLLPRSVSLELVSCYASHIDYRVLYTEYDQIHNLPREHTSIRQALFNVRKFIIDQSDIIIYHAACPAAKQERVQKYLSHTKNKLLIDIGQYQI